MTAAFPLAMSSADRIVVAGRGVDATAAADVLHACGYQQLSRIDDIADAGGASADLVVLASNALDDGALDAISRLRGGAGREFVPVVVFADHVGADARVALADAGVADILTHGVNPADAALRIRNVLAARRLHATLTEDRRTFEHRVRERLDSLVAARMAILERLALVAETRDDPTGEHPRRVGQLAAELAQIIGEPEERVNTLRRTAPLHDIGRIAIPDSILNKAGALTPDEMAVMRTHTTIGAAMLGGGDNALIIMAERIAESHHERWDGKGYPYGLAGEAIPLEARITAVADCFDAMTHDRPYRLAVPRAFALLDIQRGAGTVFDPRIAAAIREAPSAI